MPGSSAEPPTSYFWPAGPNGRQGRETMDAMPAGLREWVARSLAGGESQQTVTAVIRRAQAHNQLHSIDWSREPLPRAQLAWELGMKAAPPAKHRPSTAGGVLHRGRPSAKDNAILIARSGRLAAALTASPPKPAGRLLPASAAASNHRQAGSGSDEGGEGSGSGPHPSRSRAARELRAASRAAARLEQMVGPRRDFSRGLQLPPTAPEIAGRLELAGSEAEIPPIADEGVAPVSPAWVPGMPYTKRHMLKPKRTSQPSQETSHQPSQQTSRQPLQPGSPNSPPPQTPTPHSPHRRSSHRRSPHPREVRDATVPFHRWATSPESAPSPALPEIDARVALPHREAAGDISGHGAAALDASTGNPFPDSHPDHSAFQAGERARLRCLVADLDRRVQAAEAEARAAEHCRREAEKARELAEGRARRAEAALRMAEQRAAEAEAEVWRLRGRQMASRAGETQAPAGRAAAQGAAEGVEGQAAEGEAEGVDGFAAGASAGGTAPAEADAVHTAVHTASAEAATDAAPGWRGGLNRSQASPPASDPLGVTAGALLAPGTRYEKEDASTGANLVTGAASSPGGQNSIGRMNHALHIFGNEGGSTDPDDHAPSSPGGGQVVTYLVAGMDARRAEGLLSKSSLQALSEFVRVCGDDAAPAAIPTLDTPAV
jgi:hypothetical protein